MSELKVLFEDADVIVVLKPAGVQSQASTAFTEDMVSMIKNHLKSDAYVGVVHRLDTNVEGVMVYAKSKTAAAELSEQVKKNQIKKTYEAIVSGQLKDNKAVLVDYLCKDDNADVAKICKESDKGAKKAELNYRTVSKKYLDGRQYTRVEIDLITGRYHQIRVQFAGRKNPVIGDVKYGYPEKDRLYLCATKLSFIHPKTRKPMSYSFKPSGDLWDRI